MTTPPIVVLAERVEYTKGSLISVQSVRITTNVASSIPARGEICNVWQWNAAGRLFSPGTPVSSTNKNDRHDITEIFLKVALNNIPH